MTKVLPPMVLVPTNIEDHTSSLVYMHPGRRGGHFIMLSPENKTTASDVNLPAKTN